MRGTRAVTVARLALAAALCGAPWSAARGQSADSVELRLADASGAGRWVVSDAHVVEAVVTYRGAEDYVLVDSARLRLRGHLRCGGRPEYVRATQDDQIMPGESAPLRFEIPEATEACSIGELSGDRGEADLELWYFHSAQGLDRTLAQTVILPHSAPFWIPLLGALAGVVLANLVLILAVRTGRLTPHSTPRAFWSELAFGALVGLIVILLVRMLAPGDQPAFVRAFRAESLGHGLLLGLGYNAAAVAVLRFVHRKSGDEGGEGDDAGKDAKQEEPVPAGAGTTNDPQGGVG